MEQFVDPEFARMMHGRHQIGNLKLQARQFTAVVAPHAGSPLIVRLQHPAITLVATVARTSCT